LNAQNASEVAQRVAAGQNIVLDVDGERVELAPNEILVQTQAAEGLAVASGEGITVAIDTTLTPELAQEGLAREFVRTIQNLRKDAGFNIEDRIVTQYETASVKVREMLDAFGEYVKRETLTTDLRAGSGGDGFVVSETRVEGEPIRIAIQRA
jgi:isoleucyl-tRNA synthetase